MIPGDNDGLCCQYIGLLWYFVQVKVWILLLLSIIYLMDPLRNKEHFDLQGVSRKSRPFQIQIIHDLL